MNSCAEVIAVGAELLLGDILNTNAQFLARELAILGIPHCYQSVVGDTPSQIREAIATACKRSGLLIFTGGLGPTPDDLTTATLAEFFDARLEARLDVLADIQQKYGRPGPLPASQYKQALLPVGAEVLPNPTGSAPGMIWQPYPGVTLLTFPGVPSEMQIMWAETAVPYLRRTGWSTGTIVGRMLRFWGASESALAEKVSPFLKQMNPTVAPYANLGETCLRITAQASTAEAARALIEPIEAAIRQQTGQDCYGCDGDSLASVVGALLRSRQQSLAVAESCTAGGLGHMLTAIAGSSAYFKGGILAYDNSVKQSLLGVESNLLLQFGAVSDAVAEQMARGVQRQLNTHWALAITGIAGPGGSTPDKPVGLVYIGLAFPSGKATSQGFQFGWMRTRDWIRHVSACTALDQLRRALLSKSEN